MEQEQGSRTREFFKSCGSCREHWSRLCQTSMEHFPRRFRLCPASLLLNMNVTELPLEIHWHIATFLANLADVSSFLRTCQDLSRLLQNDTFWRDVALTLAPWWGWDVDFLSRAASERDDWRHAVQLAVEEFMSVNIKNVCDFRAGPEGGEARDFNYLVKLLLVGDCGVGKSSLLQRYFHDSFDETPHMTIGVDFAMKVIDSNVQECGAVKLQCWDTAGEEKFRSITNSYYRGVAINLLCFDLTRRKTFEQSKTHWLKDICQGNSVDNPRLVNVALIGCKLDLAKRSEIRQVTTEEAQDFARKNRWRYYETSSKTNEGVAEMFEEATRLTMARYRGLKTEDVHRFERTREVRRSRWCRT